MKSPTVRVRLVPLNIPASRRVYKAIISGTKVTIVEHDMTKIRCDAYVVPQRRIQPGIWGVAKAVANAGAQSGIDAYLRLEKEEGPFDYRDVKPTNSGGGNAPILLNIVTLDIGDSITPSHGIDGVEHLALKKAFSLSRELGLKSITVPALGTGGDLTFRESARAIKAAIKESPPLENVVISMNNNLEAFRDFVKEFP